MVRVCSRCERQHGPSCLSILVSPLEFKVYWNALVGPFFTKPAVSPEPHALERATQPCKAGRQAAFISDLTLTTYMRCIDRELMRPQREGYQKGSE